jgi:hypothetical protein
MHWLCCVSIVDVCYTAVSACDTSTVLESIVQRSHARHYTHSISSTLLDYNEKHSSTVVTHSIRADVSYEYTAFTYKIDILPRFAILNSRQSPW